MNTAFLLYIAALDATALITPHDATSRVLDAYLDQSAPAHPTDAEVTELQLAVHEALDDAGVACSGVNVLVEEEGRWLPLDQLLPYEPPPRRAREVSALSGPALVGLSGLGTTAGALSGKTVYLSQAHGFTWYDSLGRWATQRGLTNDIVEDLVNAEAIDHYLIPMLQRAGALVFPMREPDPTRAMVIVDDEQAVLTGAWASGGAGFGPLPPALSATTNPFVLGSTRVAASGPTGAPSATAAFVPVLPEDGYYGIHVSWEQAPDRASDVEVSVHHAGGVSTYRVDQRRHGATWVYLGRFALRVATARVIITNSSATPGATVSIDAVRFGGGMGVVERGDGAPPAAGPTSGRPRSEECSRYHAQFCGAPPSVYDSSSTDPNDDVANRSRYAAWQHESGEDAVFVSWHSNAPSPARGTSTWVYGPNEPNGEYDFTGAEGSDALATAVHAEIMGLIKAEWDPTWKDRGVLSAWFGELNPKHNNEMPSTLVEVAFHATAEDAAYLVRPHFRETLARGFLRGIIRYFAERDGLPPIYPPEAPWGLRVRGLADGALDVAWRPAEGDVTGYRVYAGRDGFGFDRVAETSTPQLSLADLGDAGPLAAGDRVYVYVTAYGPGGESAPTATLGATAACVGPESRVLVVQGFQRFDGGLLPREDLSVFDLGSPKRLIPEQSNTFAYTVEHGEAWTTNGLAFDAAEATLVQSGLLGGDALAQYALVDWILGEESTADETFNAAEQSAVGEALDAGAHFVVTGAEVAWDLDAKGSASDRAFLNDRFGAAYAADDADSTHLQDGTSFGEGYAVEFPDVLAALGGATVLRSYDTGGAAVVATAQTVLAGFPLETVVGASARAQLAGAFRDALGVAPTALACAPAAPDQDPQADVGQGSDAGPLVPDASDPADAGTGDLDGASGDGAGGDGASGDDTQASADRDGTGGDGGQAGLPAPFFATQRSGSLNTEPGGCTTAGSTRRHAAGVNGPPVPWTSIVLVASLLCLARAGSRTPRKRRRVPGRSSRAGSQHAGCDPNGRG